jgi:hypothetical protein
MDARPPNPPEGSGCHGGRETMDAAADSAMIDRSVADLPRALRVA